MVLLEPFVVHGLHLFVELAVEPGLDPVRPRWYELHHLILVQMESWLFVQVTIEAVMAARGGRCSRVRVVPVRGLRMQLELAGVGIAILVLLVFLSLEGEALGLGPGELGSDDLGHFNG